MYDVAGVQIAFFGGRAPLEARGSIGPYQFFFRAKGNEWEFAVATDGDADPATFDVRERRGFGIFGRTHHDRYPTPARALAEETATQLVEQCVRWFQDFDAYVRSVGIVTALVHDREHVRIDGFPQLVNDYLGGNAPVQAWGLVDRWPYYFRARHDEWRFAVAAVRDADPVDVSTPRDGFCVFGPYGRTGGEDASWMPEEVALSLIIRGARCFLAMATLFEPQLDDA